MSIVRKSLQKQGKRETTMYINKVYAIFFSPADSTKAVTEHIARQMSEALDVPCKTIDFTLPAARADKHSFQPDELVVFGVPTYAGRIPNKVLPFVQNLFEGKNTPVVCVVTYGNRNYDSSLTELVQELTGNSFKVFAAGAFVCRHVFSDRIAAGRPDADDYRKMDEFAGEAAKMLGSANSSIQAPVIRGGEPVAPYYVPKGEDGQPAKFLKAKPKTDLSKCTNCGICAEVCPMGSISHENFADVPGICIKCQACILKCPEKAKYFDDEAFLSHVRMLEKNFTERREPECFFS